MQFDLATGYPVKDVWFCKQSSPLHWPWAEFLKNIYLKQNIAWGI